MKLFKQFINWWIDERQIENGEFGGGLSDDGDLTHLWPAAVLMGIEPKKITRRNVQGARIFGPALHFPHKDYAKNSALAQALGFKERVASEDVVRFAELVADQRQLAEKFENALKRHWKCSPALPDFF